MIITAGGKNVSPSEIENHLKVSPYVREAMVVGDRRKYLVALIGIEPDTVGDWAARRGLAFTTYGDLSRKDEVRELIGEWVEEVNRDLAQVETIKRFALLEKELDHEDGELTATLKVKRRALEQRFERADRGALCLSSSSCCFNGLGARRPLRAGRARLRDHLPRHRRHQLRPGRRWWRSAPTSRTRSPTAPGCRSRSRSLLARRCARRAFGAGARAHGAAPDGRRAGVRGDHDHDRPAVHHRAGDHGDLGLRQRSTSPTRGASRRSRPATW